MSPKKGYILSIDQGTTSTRAFIFDDKGAVLSSSVREFRQFYPKPGWVEHDASQIWESVRHVIRDCVNKRGLDSKLIKAIGITNQRETTVLWYRKTGKPIGPAIVWQCRRTSDICADLKKKGLEKIFRLKTGLVLDPYFSGTKIKWYIDNKKGLREKAKRGEICFGTIDSWLIWKLSGGKEHKTDMTNASRTLIFNIKDKKWDRKLLRIMGIPYSILPRVQNSGSIFGYTVRGLVKGLNGGIPISAVMGDQQAALYGHGCYAPGQIKNTYGTGSFLVFNTGDRPIYSSQGLLTTISSDINGRPIYALEGSIFITGAAMQWLRDGLKIINDTRDSENIIKGLKDTGGVYFVPSFTGLGAPYWEPGARGLICGITRGTQRRHIVRATLEAIAYETKDVFDIMEKAFGKKIKEIAVDGGASRNNFLMQFQADILGCDIIRPKVIESTVTGVTHLAGLITGLWTAEKVRDMHYTDRRFKSKMSDSKRVELYNGWKDAVKKVYK